MNVLTLFIHIVLQFCLMFIKTQTCWSWASELTSTSHTLQWCDWSVEAELMDGRLGWAVARDESTFLHCFRGSVQWPLSINLCFKPTTRTASVRAVTSFTLHFTCLFTWKLLFLLQQDIIFSLKTIENELMYNKTLNYFHRL